MTPVIVAWVASWIMLTVVVYGVVEFSQRYLYDGTADGLPWRVIAGSAILATLLVAMPQSIERFLEWPDLGYAIVHAVAWSLVFWLLFRYVFRHAVSLALLTFVLIGPIVSVASQRLAGRDIAAPIQSETGPASKLLPKDMPPKPAATKSSRPTQTKP